LEDAIYFLLDELDKVDARLDTEISGYSKGELMNSLAVSYSGIEDAIRDMNALKDTAPTALPLLYEVRMKYIDFAGRILNKLSEVAPSEQVAELREQLSEETRREVPFAPSRVGFAPVRPRGQGRNTKEAQEPLKLHAIVINKSYGDKEEAHREAKKIARLRRKLFMRETGQSWRFRIVPKTKFKPRSFVSKPITENITLVLGNLK
jgi:hypothetical protein